MLQRLDDRKHDFYVATIVPWKDFDGYGRLSIEYSNPIRVIYSKKVLLDDKCTPEGAYRYLVVEPNYRNFEAAFMLTIKAESFMLEKNSLHGTIYSPVPIMSIDGYVHIMNDDDFIIKDPIKDGNHYHTRFKTLLRRVDKESDEIVKDYMKNILYLCHDDFESEYYEKKIISHFYSYSLIFARMLEMYFKRGVIMCIGPNMHYVWVDVNGRCYDAHGLVKKHDPVLNPPMFMSENLNRDKRRYFKEEYDKLIHDTLNFKHWPNY